MNELKDTDKDGIPDVIEDAIEDAQAVKKRFGTKAILIAMLAGLIVAGYGVFGFLYMNLSDNYKDLQNQHQKLTTTIEIEVNKARMDEREKILKDLHKKYKFLLKDKNKKKAARIKVETDLKSKGYERKNEDETSKMDIDDLNRGFNDLGFGTSVSRGDTE